MKLKLMLMSSFCFLIVSCGGGDAVYDEYHDLVCKAASGLDGSMSMSEAMDLNKQVAEFAEKNAGKMTDLKKTAEAMDITRC